ncbi:hypothetical protein HMPREF0294_0570 [Corynebacterium glucuronolyticum ATCC 51867]|nr:hypothetical protein HMPREF0294_0570 [Corynebacterium glucuronolyticum ATCC 51867]
MNNVSEYALVGLIPAGAGQIPTPHRHRVSRPAHPRRCGADDEGDATRMAKMGSSPQVRGRSGSPSGAATPSGLIPAGAGQMSGLSEP